MLTVGILWVIGVYLPDFLFDFTFSDIIGNETIATILSFASSIFLYLIACLILYLFLRKLPTLKGEPKKRMKIAGFLGWAASMRGVAMVLSLVGLLLFILLAIIIKGPSSLMDVLTKANPLLQLGSLDMTLHLVLISIVAPIMEEIMMRRLLLDALRPFGDLVAILYSGLAFGLLHMNIQQITYACGLGLMLGYVMVQTNNIYVCIGLHAFLNATTAIILPFLDDFSMDMMSNLSGMLPLILIMGFLVVLSIVGIILFFIYIKKVRLEKPRFRFSTPINWKLVLLSFGTILYIILCLAISVIVIIRI